MIANTKKNKDLWEKRYKELKDTDPEKSAAFNNVADYSETSAANSINKLCDKAYKKSVSNFSDSETNKIDDKYKHKRDVERYCSISKEKGSFSLGKPDEPTSLKGRNWVFRRH